MTTCEGGVFGRWFGHKFIKSKGGFIYTSTHCYRCGKGKGE